MQLWSVLAAGRSVSKGCAVCVAVPLHRLLLRRSVLWGLLGIALPQVPLGRLGVSVHWNQPPPQRRQVPARLPTLWRLCPRLAVRPTPLSVRTAAGTVEASGASGLFTASSATWCPDAAARPCPAPSSPGCTRRGPASGARGAEPPRERPPARVRDARKPQRPLPKGAESCAQITSPPVGRPWAAPSHLGPESSRNQSTVTTTLALCACHRLIPASTQPKKSYIIPIVRVSKLKEFIRSKNS